MTPEPDIDPSAVISGIDTYDAKQPRNGWLGDDRDREGGRTS